MTEPHIIAPGLPRPADDAWAYVLDQLGVVYGPGPWPFYESDRPAEAAEPAHTRPATTIRLSPDFALHAWAGEYVVLAPHPGGRVIAHFQLDPLTRPRGTDRSPVYAVTVDGYRTPDLGAIPADLHPRAMAKVNRVRAFLRDAICERDSGVTSPATAHDLEFARRHANRSEPSPDI